MSSDHPWHATRVRVVLDVAHRLAARGGLPADTAYIGAVITTGALGPDGRGIAWRTESDRTALRLALLRFPPVEPAVLSPARLHRAGRTLERWRLKVAGWKDLPPSQALPGVLHDVTTSLSPALCTPAVLTTLHRLEVDASISSGAKFATFVTVDDLLGLDLTRLVGLPRS